MRPLQTFATTAARTALLAGLGLGAVLSLTDWIDNRLADHDKMVHLAGFTALSVVALLAFPRRPKTALACVMAFGVLLEIAQALGTRRSFELLDLAANTFGILAVGLLAWVASALWARVRPAR
ncbi:MAG: VanZ family protein [Litorimonas sp.]